MRWLILLGGALAFGVALTITGALAGWKLFPYDYFFQLVFAELFAFWIAKKVLLKAVKPKLEAVALFILMGAISIYAYQVGTSVFWYTQINPNGTDWFHTMTESVDWNSILNFVTNLVSLPLLALVGLGVLVAYKKVVPHGAKPLDLSAQLANKESSRQINVWLALASLLATLGFAAFMGIYDYVFGLSSLGLEMLAIFPVLIVLLAGIFITIFFKNVVKNARLTLIMAILTNVAILGLYVWMSVGAVAQKNDAQEKNYRLQEQAGMITSSAHNFDSSVKVDAYFNPYRRTGDGFVDWKSVNYLRFDNKDVAKLAKAYIDQNKLAVITFDARSCGYGAVRYRSCWLVTGIRPISEYTGYGSVYKELTGRFTNYRIRLDHTTANEDVDFVDENGNIYAIARLQFMTDGILKEKMIHCAATGETVKIQINSPQIDVSREGEYKGYKGYMSGDDIKWIFD